MAPPVEEDLNVDLLIALVCKEEVIWDKTHPDYHSRSITTEAWSNVSKQLNPDFVKLPVKEKDIYRKIVIRRWRNIRDQWFKANKKAAEQIRCGAKRITRYIYHDQLLFLNKIAATELNETDIIPHLKVEANYGSGDDDASDGSAENDYNSTSTTENLHVQNEISIENHESIWNNQKRKLDHEVDEETKMNFFKSILPSLEDFSVDEFLQFQLGVLNLVQNMKRSRVDQSMSSQQVYGSQQPYFPNKNE